MTKRRTLVPSERFFLTLETRRPAIGEGYGGWQASLQRTWGSSAPTARSSSQLWNCRGEGQPFFEALDESLRRLLPGLGRRGRAQRPQRASLRRAIASLRRSRSSLQ